MKIFFKTHKKISIILGLILILVIYGIIKVSWPDDAAVTYTFGKVEKGTLVSIVSGSGQVSASNEANVTPKTSGEITSVAVKVGDTVKTGAVIARIDSRDAVISLQRAEQSLASARISYEKSTQQSGVTVDSATQAVATAEVEVKRAYEDAYDTATDLYTDMPGIIKDVNSIYYDRTKSPYFTDQEISRVGGSFVISSKYQSGVLFDKVKNTYDANFQEYKLINRNSDAKTIIALIQKTQEISRQLQDALKGTYNSIDYLSMRMGTSKPAELTTDQATLNSLINKTNVNVAALKTALDNITASEKTLTDAKVTLRNLKTSLDGVDSLDIQSAKLSLAQAETSYREAQQVLADYTIRASFDGVIASVPIKKGANVSSGTTIATLLTKERIATLSLNEIDAAKVKEGQKATMTFDALADLSISGHVIEVDQIGTVSQGVVSYAVKIAFDIQDDRIKSGMSVSAQIITESKIDTLIVPSSAIKNTGGVSYVEVMKEGDVAPKQVTVEVGSTNDSQTEITSGILEGESIVVRTITSTGSAQPKPAGSSLLNPGGSNNTRGTLRNITR